MWENFPFRDGDVGLAKTSIGFTDFQWEIFGFLCSGQRLVIVDDNQTRNPNDLISMLELNCVSHLVLVGYSFFAKFLFNHRCLRFYKPYWKLPEANFRQKYLSLLQAVLS